MYFAGSKPQFALGRFCRIHMTNFKDYLSKDFLEKAQIKMLAKRNASNECKLVTCANIWYVTGRGEKSEKIYSANFCIRIPCKVMDAFTLVLQDYRVDEKTSYTSNCFM